MPENKNPINQSLIDERLLELTTENERLKAEVTQLKKDQETLQIDYSNKISAAKIDFETKELDYKRQIRDLQKQLEARSAVERRTLERGKRKTINQLYEEAFEDWYG